MRRGTAILIQGKSILHNDRLATRDPLNGNTVKTKDAIFLALLVEIDPTVFALWNSMNL